MKTGSILRRLTVFRERDSMRRIDRNYARSRRGRDAARTNLKYAEAKYRRQQKVLNTDLTINDLNDMVEIARHDDRELSKAYVKSVKWESKYDACNVLKKESDRDYFDSNRRN